jgi:hypothetical protein
MSLSNSWRIARDTSRTFNASFPDLKPGSQQNAELAAKGPPQGRSQAAQTETNQQTR